jgi:cephalosporin hydroxylase
MEGAHVADDADVSSTEAALGASREALEAASLENALGVVAPVAAFVVDSAFDHSMEDAARSTVNAFHRLYYSRLERTWTQTYWMGIATLKCPLDLWIYQEILHEVRPDLVIECGTYRGGSALFLAGICDLLGHGEVVTIDVDPLPDRPSHPRLHYLTGSSVAPEILQEVRERAGVGSVLVILDSDHRCPHVLEELRSYRQLVTPGSYMIVEDTCVNGHPLLPDFGPGPMEAVEEFLREAAEYSPDVSREKLYMTFNPRGFLHRSPAPSLR